MFVGVNRSRAYLGVLLCEEQEKVIAGLVAVGQRDGDAGGVDRQVGGEEKVAGLGPGQGQRDVLEGQQIVLFLGIARRRRLAVAVAVGARREAPPVGGCGVAAAGEAGGGAGRRIGAKLHAEMRCASRCTRTRY